MVLYGTNVKNNWLLHVLGLINKIYWNSFLSTTQQKNWKGENEVDGKTCSENNITKTIKIQVKNTY